VVNERYVAMYLSAASCLSVTSLDFPFIFFLIVEANVRNALQQGLAHSFFPGPPLPTPCPPTTFALSFANSKPRIRIRLDYTASIMTINNQTRRNANL